MKLTPGLAAAAYLFTHALVCAQEVKLLASDSFVYSAFEQFGMSVAVSGTTGIVGAPGDASTGGWWLSGAAYLFDMTDGQLLARLVASDGAPQDKFGYSVAISGNTAIVGAGWDDDSGSNSGSAYLYDVTNPSAPIQTAKLLASDLTANSEFGWSVAISGTTAIVGAPATLSGAASGSAYLFDVSNPSVPVQMAKLLPSDAAAGDAFGSSVSIDGDMVLAGAYRDDDMGSDSGSAYLFSATTLQQVAKLLASDGTMNDQFGFSLAISGSTAIVGAPYDDDGGFQSGSAYLFDTTTGTQVAKLLASYGSTNEYFGRSSAIHGNRGMVGAPGAGFGGTAAGFAHLFDTTTGQHIVRLAAGDGSGGDEFGRSVAISDGHVLAGAIHDDDLGADSGSAYLYLSATCTSRNGVLGLNPPDFTCSNAPVLGAIWSTQIDMTPSIGSATSLTFIAMGFGGPTEGVSVFGHELLILPPFFSFSGLGTHDFPIPADTSLLGLSDSWQGARLEVVPSGPFFLVLTNALDVVYGM